MDRQGPGASAHVTSSKNKRQFKLCSESFSNYPNQLVEAEKLFKKKSHFCLSPVAGRWIDSLTLNRFNLVFKFYRTAMNRFNAQDSTDSSLFEGAHCSDEGQSVGSTVGGVSLWLARSTRAEKKCTRPAALSPFQKTDPWGVFDFFKCIERYSSFLFSSVLKLPLSF